MADNTHHHAGERNNRDLCVNRSQRCFDHVMTQNEKNQKRAIAGNGNLVKLIVNGNSIQGELEQAENGIFKINNIQNFLSEGKQSIEVLFEDGKTVFPYALLFLCEHFVIFSRLKSD